MKGRKPTPTRLKLLRGNPGKRPINDREPQPRSAVPSCPKHLDDEARREWRRVTHELRAVGLVTLIDRAMLAAYCSTWSRLVKLEAIVQRTGECIAVDGELKPNPYLGALNRALRNLHSFASEFGMSPASRARIKVDGAKESSDEFEDFLIRGKKQA